MRPWWNGRIRLPRCAGWYKEIGALRVGAALLMVPVRRKTPPKPLSSGCQRYSVKFVRKGIDHSEEETITTPFSPDDITKAYNVLDKTVEDIRIYREHKKVVGYSLHNLNCSDERCEGCL